MDEAESVVAEGEEECRCSVHCECGVEWQLDLSVSGLQGNDDCQCGIELLFCACSGYYALTLRFERKTVAQKGGMRRYCFARPVLHFAKRQDGNTGHHLLGIGYGLVAAGFYAVLTLINKFIRDLDGLANTLLQLGLSVAMLLPFVLFTSGFNIFSITGDAVVWMLVLGILHGGVGFYLFFSGMKGLQGQSIAVLSYIDPLTSLLISALVREDDFAATDRRRLAIGLHMDR